MEKFNTSSTDLDNNDPVWHNCSDSFENRSAANTGDRATCWISKLEQAKSDTEDGSFKEIRKRRRLILASVSSDEEEEETTERHSTPTRSNSRKTARTPGKFSTTFHSSPVEGKQTRRAKPANLSRTLSPSSGSCSTWPTYSSPSLKRKSCSSDVFYERNPKAGRKSTDPLKIIPCYRGYQLLGDSQLVRFSEQILGLGFSVTYTEDTNSRRLGFCVSGQKISDLKRRILEKEFKLSDRFVLLIGTNDVLQGAELASMCSNFDSLFSVLKESAKKMVILTVPPVPKFAKNSQHLPKLKEFNQFLKSYADEEKFFVVDLASRLITQNDTILTEHFEKFYNKRSRYFRPDLIHLNRSGFKLLKTVLDDEYFDKIL